MLTLAGVHVASKAADESFVNFNGSAQLVECSGLHGLADSVKQKPRGLLSYAKRAVKLIRAYTVLRVDDQPDSRQPLIEADRTIFHDGSELDAEVLFAAFAYPDAASLNKRVLVGLTARASDAIRPADRNHATESGIRIGEVFNGLKKCFREWFVHGVRTILPNPYESSIL